MEQYGGQYTSRAKAIINKTNSIGLIFLFTLTYVWYKSVIPNREFIGRIITVKEKSLYFDSVYRSLKRNENIIVTGIYKKKIDTINRRISNTRFNEASFNANRYLKNDSVFKIGLAKRRDGFNLAILPIKKLTDITKKKLTDSLIQAQFEIQVPTLSSVKTDFNIGFPIWMFLATFLLLYLSVNRNLTIYYLKKALNIFSKDFSSKNDILHLDIQLPFWLYPLRFDKNVWRGKDVIDIIDNSWSLVKIFVTIVFLGFILYMEFETVKLVWNINYYGIRYKEALFTHSYLSQVVTFIFFSISCIVFIVWCFPYNLNFQNKPKEENDFYKSRRNFIRYSLVGGVVFFLQFAPGSRLIPKIIAAPFTYKRKRYLKNSVIPTTLSGFYINNRSKTKVIHYFTDEGSSVTLKTVRFDLQGKFINKLKPIDIFDYIDQIRKHTITFPHSVWPVEQESRKYFKSKEILKGFELLELGIELNYYDHSANRLIFLLKSSLTKHGASLKTEDRLQFEKLLIKENKLKTYLSR